VADSSIHNELEIIRQIRGGDMEAFSSLFRRHYEPLCYFAERYLHDIQAAEGIVQEVFVRLWESRETLGIQSSLRSYLYASVRNACLNYVKRLSFTTSLEHEEERPDDATIRPDAQLESNELAEALEKAMESLAPKCRQIFLMAKYDGLSYKEIAEVLNISVNTVKTQLQRALKSLSKSLQHLKILLLFFRCW
jgi:RNA polymerase sigma-70 factor (ECF subfamily)